MKIYKVMVHNPITNEDQGIKYFRLEEDARLYIEDAKANIAKHLIAYQPTPKYSIRVIEVV